MNLSCFLRNFFLSFAGLRLYEIIVDRAGAGYRLLVFFSALSGLDAFDSLAELILFFAEPELIRSSPFSGYGTKKTKWMEQPSAPIDTVPSQSSLTRDKRLFVYSFTS